MVEITHTQEENKMPNTTSPLNKALESKKSAKSSRLKKRDIFFTHGMKHAGKDNYKPNKQFPNGY